MQIFSARNIFLLSFYIVTFIFSFISINSWINSLTPEHGFISKDRQYVGRDFLLFYAVAKQAVTGNINDLYTNYGVYKATQLLVPEIQATGISNWPWPYPPHYFLLLAPFTALPYYYALAAWLILSLLLPSFLLWYIWRVRGLLFLATIININVIICLVMGQNALIFSSLVGIGIAAMKKNPILAGLCFAIVSMKPHFALLLPVALILGRYWQALLYTILGTLFLMVITSLAFGWNIWSVAIAHFGSVSNISFSTDIHIFSIYSTYRALTDLGLSSHYAWSGHFLVAGIALYGFQNVWRNNHSLINKWLAFGITALLFSPFSFAYDAVWITLPILAFAASQLTENKNTFIWLLVALQVFAFAVISISNSLALLLIIGALLTLLSLSRRQQFS